ncbi:hypothetical protein HOP50_14g71420 [Chloropicon primus]|uniref:EF-hand domain-containing protein n=1 Tax=Chloropicon primus TaxID=1764295 RepID=A0A5B8MVM7_9CHLO|nr:hypothetical protein A3770_14p71210 [Chloropicon primus]UPR03812.1 hypothetical protein HOP50_14g71420 [Chloropicon primus]|eukprot:QDZ24603.1 hypothetical protein A3770_14p71210 [Chloropicon primus]
MTRTPYFTPEQRRKLESHFSELHEEASSTPGDGSPRDYDAGSYDEATAAHLCWIICQKAESRSLDIRKLFRSFDEDLDGLLQEGELKEACSYLGVDLESVELHNLVTHLGGSRTKPISYDDIESKSRFRAENPATAVAFEGMAGEYSGHYDPNDYLGTNDAGRDLRDIYRLPKSDILCQIARKIEQKRTQFTALKTFRSMDGNRDGFITKGEFDRGLQELGFHLGDEVLAELFSRFDPRKTEKIDYTHFASVIDPSCKSIRPLVVEDGVMVALPHRKKKVTHTGGAIQRPYGIEADPDAMIKEHNAYIVPKNDLLWQLAMKAEAKGKNGNFVRNVFRRLSHAPTHMLNKREFRKGLKIVFGIDIKDDEFNQLMLQFDKNNTGFINYVEFARLVNPAHYAGQSTGSELTMEEEEARIAARRIPRVLKKVAERAEVKKNGLMMAFRGCDHNHDNLISTKAVRNVIRDILNLDLSDDDFENLMEEFDPQKTGKLDHNEFVTCVLNFDHRTNKIKLHEAWQPSPISNYRRNLKTSAISKQASEFIWQLSLKMQAKGKSTRDIFRKYDRDHDGKLGFEELRMCIESLGWQLKPRVLQEVMNEIDVDGTGEVDYMEIAKLVEVEGALRNRLDLKDISKKAKGAEIQKTEYGMVLAVQKDDLIYQISQKIEEKIGFSAAPRLFASCKSRASMQVKGKDDRVGFVSEGDFREVVMRLGWTLTDDNVSELKRRMDCFKDNMVDYMDFLETLRLVELRYNTLTPMKDSYARGSQMVFEEDEDEKDDTPKAKEDILERVANMWPDRPGFTSLKHFFAFDPLRCGILSSSKFRMAIRIAGCHLSDFEYSRLMKVLGINDDDDVNYHSFLSAIESLE